MFEILVLSLVQGITEFLPISSSSHLFIISKYFSFNNQNLLTDVSLHIGSFLAVLTFFKSDILDFVKNKRLFVKIILCSLPTMVVGYLLVVFNLIDYLRNIKIIGWMTLIFGIFLYISDKYNTEKEINSDFTFKSIIVISLFQILSLIPGVSRSGITISAARLLKFKRYDSVKLSFLLSIPTLAAVSIYGVNNILNSDNIEFSLTQVGLIFLSFIISYMTIKFFLGYVKKFNLNIFIIYRIIIGCTLIIISYL